MQRYSITLFMFRFRQFLVSSLFEMWFPFPRRRGGLSSFSADRCFTGLMKDERKWLPAVARPGLGLPRLGPELLRDLFSFLRFDT